MVVLLCVGLRFGNATWLPAVGLPRSALSTDFSTTYLGIPLSNPFIVGASPLADRLDPARRLEDAGCAAIVLHSRFEEQISHAQSGPIHLLDPLDRDVVHIVSYFPEPQADRSRRWPTG